MKSGEQTRDMLERLKVEIKKKRGDIVLMFCEAVKEHSGEMSADSFWGYFTGIDNMRLEVLRDMIENGWMHVNLEGKIEVGDGMPIVGEMGI